MKNSIYLIAGVLLIFSCKKESNNSTPNTVINSNYITVTDIEGNKYNTVVIGTQTWMKENLKVSKFNEGTNIPGVTDNRQWSNLTTGAWCNYNNNDSLGKVYGKLYNWYVISPTMNGNKNVCPIGWHIPTDVEWKILSDFLGGDTIAGGKMKDASLMNWKSPNTNANNSSGFNGLPAGDRISDGKDDNLFSYAFWWSSSEIDSKYSTFRRLNYNDSKILRDAGYKNAGLSIRCIKE